MVEKLSFGEPFFHTVYLENETYSTGKKSLVLNLDRILDVQCDNQTLKPLRSAVYGDCELHIPGKALVIEDFDAFDICDDANAGRIKTTWPSVWELTHAERNRGVEYYKSPASFVANSINLNYCFGEKQCAAGLHRAHKEPDFDEFHLQICGCGSVQLFRENDAGTLYQSLPLAPGIANDPIWRDDGSYPWHRYFSETRCVFLVIEMNREEV